MTAEGERQTSRQWRSSRLGHMERPSRDGRPCAVHGNLRLREAKCQDMVCRPPPRATQRDIAVGWLLECSHPANGRPRRIPLASAPGHPPLHSPEPLRGMLMPSGVSSCASNSSPFPKAASCTRSRSPPASEAHHAASRDEGAERYGSHTADLVNWEISRQEADARLEQLLQGGETGRGTIERGEARAGPPGGVRARRAGARRRSDSPGGARRARPVRLEPGQHGPAGSVHDASLGPHRTFVARARPRRLAQAILVPLDGSLRTGIPTAARIARAHGAELLLAFVTTNPVATAIMSGDVLDLARELASRLESAAGTTSTRARTAGPRRGAGAHPVLRSSDERRALIDLSGRMAATSSCCPRTARLAIRLRRSAVSRPTCCCISSLRPRAAGSAGQQQTPDIKLPGARPRPVPRLRSSSERYGAPRDTS